MARFARDDVSVHSSAASHGAKSGQARVKTGLSGERKSASNKYEFVRMLYRGADHGVTASYEGPEVKAARKRVCKTTGWQSRFSAPYRPLGTPDLKLSQRQGKLDQTQERKVQEEVTVRKEEQEEQQVPCLSAREMQQLQNGVTPSGRPVDWLPEAKKSMVLFAQAARQNKLVFQTYLLSSVKASEGRLRCVRAGQMATRVLAEETAGEDRSPVEDQKVFITGMKTTGEEEEKNALAGLHGRKRPNHVPPLRLGTVMTREKEKQPTSARSVTQQSSRSMLSSATQRETASRASTARDADGRDAQAPGERPKTVRKLTARAAAISGNIGLAHPVPPLKIVAETFFEDVDTLTERMRSELSSKNTERLDTFRRKYKNFEIGEIGSSSERQLKQMRESADQEKLQSAIYLHQNRKWFSQLLMEVCYQPVAFLAPCLPLSSSPPLPPSIPHLLLPTFPFLLFRLFCSSDGEAGGGP
mmetsp:Transcript_26067/g.59021  ORF Transcript_26067/g.59021 Transcript_26067/m.59021 type:complete len:472 (-) Transcript_26067:552-1967(-)